MPTRRLPNDPNLEQLKNHAAVLQRVVRARVPDAVELVREFHPRLATIRTDDPELLRFSRADAQLVIARQYGFASWPKLRHYLDVVAQYARSPHREPSPASTSASATASATGPVDGAVDGSVERDHDDDHDHDGVAALAGMAEQFLRLACLTHGDDDPARWRRAAELLVAHRELATVSIHTAAAAGDVEGTREHLERDPSLAGRHGGPHRWEPLLYLAYSALDGASACAHVEVARLLLDAGADPNAGYLWEGLPSPYTALTGALGPHGNSLLLARLLLERGADPNDSQALYELWEAHDVPGPLELLFEFGLGTGRGGPWHGRLSPAHPTPAQLVEDELLKAAAGNWPRRAAVVLAHGVDINGHGTNHPILEGHTAYQLAVLNGSAEVVELLAAAGARPQPPDPVVEFLGACIRADRPIVEQMRAQDPTIVGRAITSRPHQISTAADQDRLDAVTLMVEVGFDVNAADRYPHQQTPLHGAAYNGNLAMVEYLVAHGADPTTKDCSYNATPLGWADHNNQRHIVDYLSNLPA